MSRDPTKGSVLQFRKKRLHNWPAQSAGADMLAEALLVPTPLEPDAREPLPRGKKLYGHVPIQWLALPAMHEHLKPTIRLYLYMQIKSRRGARTVRLTNDLAAQVGIDRRRKAEALRRLERLGLITVTRKGQQAPVVSVRRFTDDDYG